LPRLFDPYRQGQRSRGSSQGLGLGLFITQEIVHAHGGRIDVHSTAAEGTRFSVTLPRG
jgi:signal transduction histidine kinase